MQDNQRNQSNMVNARESLDVVYLLARGLAACVWPFLRTNFGANSPGVPGLIAFAIIILYAAAENAPVMLDYLIVWLVVLASRRLRSKWRAHRGRGEHSQYDGWPVVAIKIPFVRTEEKAKGIEPFLCFFAGVFICPLSEPIGKFVMLGAAGLLVTRMIELRTREARVRRMRDAMIEMQQMSEDVRGRR